MGKLDNWWVFPGFEIECVATGLNLPVNLAFVPNPVKEPKAPLLYVTELYGQIKVFTSDWTMHTYAENLLNYQPDHHFPGTGESGVTGLCVDPKSGDIFTSMIYMDNGEAKNRVIQMSSKSGLKADSITTIIDNIPSTTRAHQIQALSIGFDGKLYVNIADGGDDIKAQDDNDFRGKILRLNLDGTIPVDNPQVGSPVYAKGFRNPFGAAWRKSDRSLYVSINGPDRDDVIAKVKAGGNHGWPDSMRRNALFVWEFTQAPTAMAFMQDGQFPGEYEDQLFVALFGNSYTLGRDVKGKKIVKMNLGKDVPGVISYDEFITYIGDGAATPCGLAFGPGGLYFSDLHGERDGLARVPEGNVYRVKPRERKATATLRGVILAQTTDYKLVETNVYFPPESVNWQYFTKSDKGYSCPWKGEAIYYNISVEAEVNENEAWSYPEPKEGVKQIKDYIAFAYGEVEVRTERSA